MIKWNQSKLPKFEVYFYFGTWIFGIFYSLYHVYIVGNASQLYFTESDLSNGWSFLNRKKDTADYEWNLWTNQIVNLAPWIITHYSVSQIMKNTFTKILPLWYITITTICMLYQLGVMLSLILLSQPVVFYIVMKMNRKSLIWVTSFIVVNTLMYHNMLWEYNQSAGYDRIMIASISLLWLHLRCISFSLDMIMEQSTKTASFVYFWAYAFYLPFFFLGPIVLHNTFHHEMIGNKRKCKTFDLLMLVFNNIRYFAWLYFTEFVLHYIYVNALLLHVETFQRENVWVMYGLGYSMGQFFFFKYTVVYGLSISWARAEGYTTPNPPKCVACIHLYSEMWRYFDEGLYFFLKRYIYKPYIGVRKSIGRKIANSLLCFIFVFAWHGLYLYVFLWTLLNFIGITIEAVAKYISTTTKYKNFKKFIGTGNEQRFIAFICAPLTITSAISNFYFLGGVEVGNTYFNYVLTASWPNILCLWFFVYALCQVSSQLHTIKSDMKNIIII